MDAADDDWLDDQLLEVDPPVLGKAKVLLTSHARKQMRIRGVSNRQVLQVIRNPHEFLDADMGSHSRPSDSGGRNERHRCGL